MSKSCFVWAAAFAPWIISAAEAAAPAWKPDRPVEIVINTAPGSGADKAGRVIQKILQERRLIEVPVSVTNRPGGGGAIAYNYLNQHAGDAHVIAIASKSLLSNNIAGRGPGHTEFTQLALMSGEYIGAAVRTESSLKSGQDLVERLKKDVGAASLGVATSLGGTNHQAVAGALHKAGIDVRKVRAVVFQSGGNAITAMLGGHVDVVPASLGSWVAHLKNKTVRILAVAAPQRQPGLFADVPTWRELGWDNVVSNWRSVIAPRGLTEPQMAYWEQVLRRVSQTDDWKAELESSYASNDFMGPADTRKYMDADYAEMKAFLTQLQLAK